MVDRKHLNDLLQLIIQDQHKGTTHASENIGPGSLEESLATLITRNLLPAVNCATVHDVSCNRKKKIYIYINLLLELVNVHLKGLKSKAATDLLCVQTASSYDDGLCRRGKM